MKIYKTDNIHGNLVVLAFKKYTLHFLIKESRKFLLTFDDFNNSSIKEIKSIIYVNIKSPKYYSYWEYINDKKEIYC
jgi:hypothetical protein